MTYPRREVYAHAPLAMVTVEVQLNYEPLIKKQSTLDVFGTAVREVLPVLELSGVFLKQKDRQDSDDDSPKLRAIRQDGQAVAALSPTSLSLSVSGESYRGYKETFEPLLRSVVEAYETAVPNSSVRRIGLRYLDEIRVPEPPSDLTGWSHWIAPELVAASTIFPGGEHNGIRAFYHNSEGDRELVCSWGTFHGATVVGQDQPFSRSGLPETRMFVLDVDSATKFPEYHIFGAGDVLETVKILHEPIGLVFQSSITD
ncbi:TIGR04255 family protein, partial [Mycobacterium sp. 4D054]|uniref:TIGR04255 family protein n=1 Tax=Mycobacterium sp. 4D054 TaxID=3457440 RepID=UPI003FD0CB3C